MITIDDKSLFDEQYDLLAWQPQEKGGYSQMKNKIIVGGKIMTATKGQRVVIDETNSIKFYDADNVLTGSLLAGAGGSMAVTGQWQFDESVWMYAENYLYLFLKCYSGVSNIYRPELYFARSRGSASSQEVVIEDDYLGQITFRGYDGSAEREAARIRVQVDGTPGTNDMPGRMMFFTTPDGSKDPVERLRIDNAGDITFKKEGAGTYFYFKNYHTSTSGNYIYARKARGTEDTPLIVGSADRLFAINAYGYDGASWLRAAAIEFKINGTPGTNDMPGAISFLTTKDGENIPGQAFKISNGRNLGMGLSVGWGTNAEIVFAMQNGVAPTTSISNGVQFWSDDYGAGHACLHIRNEDGDIIKLEQQAHIADAPGDTAANNAVTINAILVALENMGLLSTS